MTKKKIEIFLVLILLIISMISISANAVMIKQSEKTDDQIEWIYKPGFEPHSKKTDHKEYQNYNPMIYPQSNQKKQSIDLLNGPIDSAWPMASRNNHHTGLSPYSTSSNPGHEIWRYETRGSVDTGIAIDTDGTLYFGDFSGDLTALNPDGSIKWKYDTGHIITMSTSCIGEDGTIYFGCNDHRLYALNPDGTLKWRASLGGNIGGAPAIADDGTIYVGHMDNEMCAVYPNGTIKWKYLTGDFITSDPAIADNGNIIFGSRDDYVYSLFPNGTLNWSYKTDGGIKGGASIDDAGIIYIASWDGCLYALHPNGTLKWKTEIGDGSETTPCFGPDGTIYVSYEELYAIDPTDGGIKWTYDYPGEDEASWLSNPAISSDGIIYIGVMDVDGDLGAIYVFNPDGALRWRKYIAEQGVYSSPSIAEDGTVYIGSWWHNSGRLHAFNEWTGPNNPPSKPVLEGNNQVKEGWTYRLYPTATDPENHTVAFIVDWGDGEIEESVYAFPNEKITIRHTYYISGSVKIRAKTIDAAGSESDWSYKQIEVPYSYQYPGWQWLMHRFPLIQKLFDIITTIIM